MIDDYIEDTDSVRYTRRWIFEPEQIKKGSICPVCDQIVREYKRKLNSGMATSLIWLYHETSPIFGFIHVPSKAPRYVLTGSQLQKLFCWQLILPEPNKDDPAKKCSGKWCINNKGINFVCGRSVEPMYIYIYNGKVNAFSERTTTIQEALGNKFHYQQMMQANWREYLDAVTHEIQTGDL